MKRINGKEESSDEKARGMKRKNRDNKTETKQNQQNTQKNEKHNYFLQYLLKTIFN